MDIFELGRHWSCFQIQCQSSNVQQWFWYILYIVKYNNNNIDKAKQLNGIWRDFQPIKYLSWFVKIIIKVSSSLFESLTGHHNAPQSTLNISITILKFSISYDAIRLVLVFLVCVCVCSNFYNWKHDVNHVPVLQNEMHQMHEH